MATSSPYHWRNELLWGILLITIGTILFLDRLDILEAYPIWHYWPLVMVVFGINQMIGFTKAKHVLGGLWLIFLGLWLFVSIEHIWGLSFRTSWPFLLIAWGLKLILKPVIRQYVTPKETVYGN